MRESDREKGIEGIARDTDPFPPFHPSPNRTCRVVPSSWATGSSVWATACRPPPSPHSPSSPPFNPSPLFKSNLQGGSFELGDRVISVGNSLPPFGLRGTVIGIYDESCEVYFDEEFPGGTDLSGRVKVGVQMGGEREGRERGSV